MDGCDNQRMIEFTRTIFGGTRSHSPEVFQEWALEQAKALIPFDCCKWGAGIVQENQATIHSVHQHNIADKGMQEYLRHQGEDGILAKMIATRDRVVTYDRYEITPREAFINMPIYREYISKFRIEQLVSTMVPEPVSNLFSVVSFGRFDYERPFSEREKEIKTMITPVLTEARRHNLFIHMIQVERSSPHTVAICDGAGILHHAEPAFAALMAEEWTGWQGPQLNFIPQQILDGGRSARFEGNRIDVLISVMHDLVVLQARRRSPLDILSTAERRVALLLLQGLSDKEIANHLNISPKTVGHHLQRIYKKVGVANRQQAIATIQPLSRSLQIAPGNLSEEC